MRPPRCAVCRLDLDKVNIPEDQGLEDFFTLVQFALDAQEQHSEKVRRQQGVTGHPLGAYWFCSQHRNLGETRSGMHWREALEEARAEFRRAQR